MDVPKGELTRCTIPSLSSDWLRQTHKNQINRVDGRTCNFDTNWIYKLIEERPAATPPLKYCNTPGSDMEWEQLDQESCLHPRVFPQNDSFKMTQIA